MLKHGHFKRKSYVNHASVPFRLRFERGFIGGAKEEAEVTCGMVEVGMLVVVMESMPVNSTLTPPPMVLLTSPCDIGTRIRLNRRSTRKSEQ